MDGSPPEAQNAARISGRRNGERVKPPQTVVYPEGGGVNLEHAPRVGSPNLSARKIRRAAEREIAREARHERLGEAARAERTKNPSDRNLDRL